MYGDGKGYVPDTIVPGSAVAILAQNPGDFEERGQQITGWAGKRQPIVEACSPAPLIGPTGFELFQHYAPLAGLLREDVSLCNIIKCRWQEPTVDKKGDVVYKRTNKLPPAPMLAAATAHCTAAHLAIPPATRVIVAFGDEAFQYTQSNKSLLLSEWRGFIAPDKYEGRDVYAVIHLAAVLRDPKQRLVAKHDWRRLGHLLRGTWPLPLPHRLVISRADDYDAMVLAFVEATKAASVTIDTEYIPESYLLRIIAIGWRGDSGISGVQIDWLHAHVGSYVRAVFTTLLKRLISTVPVVAFNFKDAELPALQKAFDIKYEDYCDVQDPMQKHAVRWSDLPHDLEFLASILGEYPKLKHLQATDELTYNWGDVIETIVVNEKLDKELADDQQTKHIYDTQNMPLLPILRHREQQGLRLNQSFIEAAIPPVESRRHAACLMAEAYTGLTINLGSPGASGQLGRFLQVEGVKVKGVDDDEIAHWRDKFAPFDSVYEQKEGLSVEYITRRIEQEGAHPLLEVRAMYAKDQQILSHYLVPLRGRERCYPRINIHPQATGRHSTTDPPLATLPSKLRGVVVPDLGQCWVGGDYDQQELRIFAAEARDDAFLQAFQEGYDIHTLNTCDLFDLPRPPDLRDPHKSPQCTSWRAAVTWGLGAEGPKDDVRRVFAKRFVYRLVYFALAGLAHTIPGAKALGIQAQEIDQRAIQFLSKHPAIPAYRRRIEYLAGTIGETRTWAGRRRACLKGREEAIRALGNHPMQGGGVDILNLTIIQVCRELPFASYAFGMHDSFYFALPVHQVTNDNIQHIYDIASQPRRINGLDVPFPLSMKIVNDKGESYDWRAT